MSLSRQSITSDLSLLLSIPNTTIPSILDPPSHPSTSSKDQKSIDVLNTFSSKTATNKNSQALAKAYITQMNGSKILDKSGEVEKLGERIDELRERGQGLESVLGEVKV
uniref:Uncharacterized protein n=1 Tax=Kwoniella dejecticola CBS 10117 TaxID=1296121 RepID=A0A1A5ZU80_9TREE|nr:uncharacterized protein I303_08136 [Kwoniella dejecticola CBS 10117]OBR81366.1 hypothetical protein I303_08136 [Kwoniella dejecticola CBS 10117]